MCSTSRKKLVHYTPQVHCFTGNEWCQNGANSRHNPQKELKSVAGSECSAVRVAVFKTVGGYPSMLMVVRLPSLPPSDF